MWWSAPWCRRWPTALQFCVHSLLIGWPISLTDCGTKRIWNTLRVRVSDMDGCLRKNNYEKCSEIDLNIFCWRPFFFSAIVVQLISLWRCDSISRRLSLGTQTDLWPVCWPASRVVCLGCNSEPTNGPRVRYLSSEVFLQLPCIFLCGLWMANVPWEFWETTKNTVLNRIPYRYLWIVFENVGTCLVSLYLKVR